MKYLPIDNELFIKNRNKLKERLKANSLAIIRSNDELPKNGDQNFSFRQHSDLFYLTGIDQEKTILTICPDHPDQNLREVLFIIKADKKTEIWYGHKLTTEEATKLSGIKNIQFTNSFEQSLNDLMLNAEHIFLNLNENPRFTTDIPYCDLRFVHHVQKLYPLHHYHRLAPLLTALRVVKEPEEIALMQTACNITEKAFRRVLRFLKPNVMEYEVEAELTHEYIRNRANGHAYPPIVASGKNACVLHYVENNSQCKDGDLLLMDFGAEYANYAADCSRTIPVNGKFSPRQREVYQAVLRVMKQAIPLLVPGTTIDTYHKQVCKIMEDELIGLGLINQQEVDKENEDMPLSKRAFFRYYMHGTSHFMGLDVHDVGSKHQTLQKGMVFSCEPGIYIPEENIGIRIENDIVVDDLPIDLMKDIPREVDEIEALMANK